MNNNTFNDLRRIEELEEIIEYPPKKLYKYISADTCYKIIENKSIRMTSPCDFNDPYDSKPIFRCSNNIIRYDRKKILEILKKERKFAVLDKNKQKRRLLFLKDFPDATCEVSFKDEIEETRDIMCSNSRVLCLSEEKDNILMWSHYAQNHSGVVIEFNTEHNILKSCRKVIYSNKAPYINGTFILKDNLSDLNIDDMKEIVSILYTKSKVWEYEKEWRLYFNFTIDNNLTEMLKDYVDDKPLKTFKKEVFNTKKYIHLPLFNNHITALYLGYNINKKNETKIVHLCKKNYPKAKIYKATLDTNYYKINYVEYDEFYRDNRDEIEKLAEIIAKKYSKM